MRAEDNQRGASAFHGADGPLRVEDPRHVHAVCGAWLEAARTMGLEGNDDFNGAEQDGVGYYQLNQRGGRRWSAADAYLRPAMRRSNLTVETDAMATRIVVEGGRAVGVRYLRRGVEHEARTQGEVILCGGSINSPQLLMLSGIGPAGHLREHGIDVVVDAPGVGAGLQDHPLVLPEWSTPSIPGLMEEATPENMALWQREGRGPMASSGAEVAGFARTRQGLQAPDLQFGAAPLPSPVDLDPTQPPPRVVVTLVIAIDVASRGSLRLRSADPRSKPAIDPAYLAAEADLDTLVAGVRLAREIAAHEPLAGMVAGEHAPGERVRDEEQLRDWIRRNLSTCFHPTSTCAMGGGDGAVCDPELRVRGVRGLRVVDASVMPAVPRGNTNAPTMAIAERAADLIRGDTPLAPAHLELEPTSPERA
jgi:choline dehydrogenase